MIASAPPGPSAVRRRWPVRCPVDQRWLAEGDRCPDCDSSADPLWALNALAEGLLEDAATATLQESTALALVQRASTLVPSTEAFHEAAADALERAGHRAAALVEVRKALSIAPLRQDLRLRAQRLETPLRPVEGRSRAARPLAQLVAASGLFSAGAVAAILVIGLTRSPALAPPSAAPAVAAVASPAPAASASPWPAVSPAPRSTPVPTQPTSSSSAIPAPAEVVRAALAQAGVDGLSALAVEQVGDTVRISGPVDGAAARRRLIAILLAGAPGVRVDLAGVTVVEQRQVFVQPGDTMWSIAARQYGDPSRWPSIAAANPRSDPNHLHIGERLVVP